MTITANLADGRTLNFPDGTDPQVVQDTVKRIVSQGPAQTPSTPDPNAPNALGGPAYNEKPQPQSMGTTALDSALQGLTGGTADEITAGIGSALSNVPYNDILSDYRNEIAQGAKQNPITSFAGNAAGGIVGGAALGAGVGAIAPKLAQAAGAFAEANPYTTGAITGGATGALYGFGTGEGGAEERGKAALETGAIGVPLGVAGTYVARNVIAPAVAKLQDLAGSLSDKAGEVAAKSGEKAGDAAVETTKEGVKDQVKDQLDNVIDTLTGPTAQKAEQAATGNAAATDFSDITNKPLASTPSPDELAAKPNLLGLSPGVRTKDVELLRTEDNARQGTLGKYAQDQMASIDSGVNDDVRNVLQSLKGNTTKPGNEILVKSIDDFRDASDKAWEKVNALYNVRNEKLADAVGDPAEIGNTLGNSLKNVVNDPQLKYSFQTKSNAGAQGLYDDFNSIVDKAKEDGSALPFGQLEAWRKDVSDLAGANLGNQQGLLAKKLGSAYDDWLENGLKPDMIKSGDPALPDLLQGARQARAQYGKLFQSNVKIGESKLLENITEQYAKSPDQFVKNVFGGTLKGNGNTAQVVQRMTDALPDDASKTGFTDNVFSGLISNAFEKATAKGDVSYPTLRNGLQDIYNSEVYKNSLSSDVRNDLLPKMINDLSQQIEQGGRRDVISPSGGAVGRFIQNMGKVPGMGFSSEALSKAAEMAQTAKSRINLNRAMQAAGDEVKTRAGMGTMNPRLSGTEGLYGGVTGGAYSATLNPPVVEVTPAQQQGANNGT